MVAVNISSFGGMIPSKDARLIPQNHAARAENAWFYDGTLRGLGLLRHVRNMNNAAARSVFRLPKVNPSRDNLFDAYWLEFPDEDTTVIKSPVANDQFERYYISSPLHAPQYNTRARLENGDPNYILGVPAPIAAPSVGTVGGSAPTESRAYVYTWVTSFGEEGPPSPPTLHTGNIDATWNIGMTAPTSGDTTGRSISHVRIYRAVTTTTGSATYLFVAELAIATTSYADTNPSSLIAANNPLQSFGWTAPPVGLDGFVTLPNGMVAGFVGNEVWYCEPYRPHAWPAAYSINVDYKIVGLGVVAQTLVILTEVAVYAAAGVNPSSVSLTKLTDQEPCTARGSIVSTASGVFYSSPNGPQLVSQGTVTAVVRALINKEQWIKKVNVSTLRAAMLGTAYMAFGNIQVGVFQEDSFQNDAFPQGDFTGAYSGFLADTLDGSVAWTDLTSEEPIGNVLRDVWSGEIFLVKEGKLLWLDVAADEQDPYVWYSKIFQPPTKKNFQAMRVFFDGDPATQLSVFADGRPVMRRPLGPSGSLIRLPSGFKADFWQVALEGSAVVSNIQLATSVQELGNV